MIEQLRIRDLGVIDDAVVELHPGLNVVTGETGAGKTMVVTGLGLLLGDRADSSRVRAGATRAQVEGVVEVADGALRRLVTDAGGRVDSADAGEADAGGRVDGAEAADGVAERSHGAGSVVLVRTVTAEGRSRAHVGGAAAPVSLLGELGAGLVAVHGQSDQQLLRSPAHQRDVLDRFGGAPLLASRAGVAAAYARWRQLADDLADRTARAGERAREADLLRHGLEQVEAVAPQAGEDASLAAEAQRLSHADGLREAADLAHASLTGESAGEAGTSGDDADVLTLVARARQALDAVAAHDEALAALAVRLREVGVLATEVAGDLASYATGVETDPARLAAVEERRSRLIGLMRTHGPSLDDVLAWAQTARGRLVELDDSDDRLAQLGEEVVATRTALRDRCRELSTLRTSAAQRLASAATDELTALAMPEARLHVAVSQRPAEGGLEWDDGTSVAVTSDGVDDVELQLQPHADGQPLALRRSASGGELSRVMLALEVVLAGDDPVGTFVFDEVDAGVGGAAAIEVGRRLARLAQHRQVIVVTHLPQVAAFADRHLVVSKSTDGHVTASGVHALDAGERRAELARMLAGLTDSELGKAHASELLDLAARDRVTTS